MSGHDPEAAVPDLVDAAARHAIEHDLDHLLFVEAGAGSGKTSALVKRIVRLITTGRARLSDLAAITFTEAAGAELRTRIRRALELVAAEPGAADLEPDGPAARSRLALEQLDEAAIGTIHGFCQRILAEHPLEAGLPPGFVVLDEVRAAIAWRARWATTLDVLLGEPGTRDVVAAAWSLGMEEAQLETLARLLDESWDACGDDRVDAAAVVAGLGERVAEGGRAVVGLLRDAIGRKDACKDAGDSLAVRLDGLTAYLGRLERAGHVLDLLRLLALDPRPSLKAGSAGRKAAWEPGALDEVRGLLKAAEALRLEVVDEASDAVLRAVVVRLERLARAAAAERRARGELRFHDLLVLARDLVRDDAGVCDELRRRYRYVLVDEFQDTDPLQLELVELLQRPLAGGDEAPADDRVFFVGDPKQAIYRFRGADLGVYDDAKRRLCGGRPVALTTSFRSVPGIIDFVNATFGELWGDGFSPLDAARADGPGARHPVRVVGGELTSPTRLKAAERRALEAGAIVAAIDEATTGAGWSVADPAAEGGERRARLGDVAVLVPRRTGLDVLEQALDAAGIPYRLESATLLYGSQEVRDLLHLARAIDDAGDQLSLVAALRSPAFGCGDDDLAAFRRAGGRWSLEVEPDAALASGAVGRALATLRRWRADRLALGPVAVLERAVAERRLFQVVAGEPRATESWRRLRFVLEQARAFTEAGGGGLADFADWVEEQVTGNLRAVESTVPDLDEDAVRILTIHGAKGLEFPVAIVAGLGSDRRGGSSAGLLRTADGRPEVQLRKGRATSGYEALRLREDDEELAEELRLLYVAVTRARDHLVVCTHHTPTTGYPSLAQRLAAAAAAAAGEQTEAAPPSGRDERAAAGRAVSPRAVAPGPPGGTEAGYEHFLDARQALTRRAARGEALAATAVAAEAGEAGPVERASVDDELPAWRRGRAGTEVGRAVHAVLQSVELGPFGAGLDPAEALALVRPVAVAQARAERVPERADDVARYAVAALTSPIVEAAIASGTARRELFVAVRVGERLLEGFVDLLFEHDGGLVVVDYKTDAVSGPDEADAALERHRLQAGAYALALERATGRPVARCVLLFLAAPGRAIERELDDLPGLVADVEQVVTAGEP